MNLKDLYRLVSEGEGQQLEFKLKSNHPHKIVREMVAFANSDGGKLLVGIADNKEIRGLKYADEDEYVLEKEILKSIQPPLDYEIEKLRLEDGKEVLIFDIPSGENRPYAVVNPENVESKKVYVRVADKSIQASKEIKEILKGLTKGKSLRFSYGEKETLLMKYLGENKYVTVEQFSDLAEIPRRIASRTLILLVLTHVLGYRPKESGDQFYML
jgi:predicted HTH transcriptional regulator